MKHKSKTFDQKIEFILSFLLRSGVLLSAFVVMTGGILYLLQFGGKYPHYQQFRGESIDLRNIRMIVQGAFDFHPLSLIQFGLLILLATPVARVLFSVISFLIGKDYLYVVISLIVLLIVGFSIFSGYLV
jgi:uncharacterized membrane protein